MELAQQIRNHRTALGLSQEDLSEKIYVSRQTISNWETDRTYPDVQSLLLLSALFDVTIDELVKGDVEAMKETVDATTMKKLSWVMAAGLILGIVTIAPSFKFWDFPGLIVPFVFWAIGMAAAIFIERLKKRHDVKTYSEILAFVENTPLDREKAAEERKRHLLTKTLMVIGVGIASGLIVFGSMALLFG